jgi:hypothetical protein
MAILRSKYHVQYQITDTDDIERQYLLVLRMDQSDLLVHYLANLGSIEYLVALLTLRTVRLPGTTKAGCQASRFPCKLACQTTKYFAFLLIF